MEPTRNTLILHTVTPTQAIGVAIAPNKDTAEFDVWTYKPGEVTVNFPERFRIETPIVSGPGAAMGYATVADALAALASGEAFNRAREYQRDAQHTGV